MIEHFEALIGRYPVVPAVLIVLHGVVVRVSRPVILFPLLGGLCCAAQPLMLFALWWRQGVAVAEWHGSVIATAGVSGAIIGQETTALDILATRMNEKMQYGKGERDMIVLLHRFVARFPGKPDEHITSTLIDFGEPNGDSSMARTVSLPAAVGVKLILTGKITDRGVHVPVKPAIYNPVLDELATMKIRCVEKTTHK